MVSKEETKHFIQVRIIRVGRTPINAHFVVARCTDYGVLYPYIEEWLKWLNGPEKSMVGPTRSRSTTTIRSDSPMYWYVHRPLDLWPTIRTRAQDLATNLVYNPRFPSHTDFPCIAYLSTYTRKKKKLNFASPFPVSH